MANMRTTTIGDTTYWLLDITRANNPSGYAEKLLTASTFVDKSILVSVPSATATVSATYETLNAAGTSPTSVTSQYFKITPTATISVAGWISDAPSTTAQNYTVRAATFPSSAPTTSDTGIPFVSISGWVDGPTYLEGLEAGGINFTHGNNDIQQWTIAINNSGTLGSKTNVSFNNTALVTNGAVVQGSLAAPTISITNVSGNVITAQQFTLTATSQSGNAGFIDAAASGSPTTRTYAVQLAEMDYVMTNLTETTTAGTYQMNTDTATIFADISKAGWVGTDQDLPTITIKAPTVQTGSLANESHKTSGVTYTALNAPILEADSSSPAQYWLYINEGYYTASKISLGTMVPDAPSTPDATSNKILSGYEAFDISGHRIVGSMLNKGKAVITGSASNGNMIYSISGFQEGYYNDQQTASVLIYDGEIEEISFSVTVKDHGDSSIAVYDGMDTSATLLGSVIGSNSVTPNSETFTCTSGYLCLESYESLTYTGDQQVGSVTLHYGTTGGVTFLSETQDYFPTIVVYRVTDDGTITAASYN